MRAFLIASMIIVLAHRAEAREWDLGFGSSALVASSPSMDALSSHDTIAFGGISLAAKIADAPFVDGLFIDASWQIGGTHASDFASSIQTDLSLQTLRGGVTAVRYLTSKIRAFGRADVGVMTGSIGMSAMAANGQMASIGDRSWTPCTYLGAGLEALSSPRTKGGFMIGLRLEGGFLAAADMSFDAKPSYPNDGTAHIVTAAAPLGAANASGWSLGLTVFARW
jgi:hypothetical protein